MAIKLTNIAIFGGSGNLGSPTISALLATGIHKVRAIVRLESTATLPPGVDVVKGDLASNDFLVTSLAGQDAIIITLGLSAPQDVAKGIVIAAAEAGVKYILPDEFVSQDSLRKHFPFRLHERKNEIRHLIERLGKSAWVAIVNGTWYDFSLLNGAYGIDISKRTANLYHPGTVVANVTTLAKVSKAIAALLSLTEDKLAEYANRCVYISSFRVSQLDILHGLQRATGTVDKDWDILYEDVDQAIQDGWVSVRKGNADGSIKVIYAMQFKENSGSDYESTKGTSNMGLGLADEDFDEVTRSVVAKAQRA